MTNKLPKFIDKHKICIICEGSEEYEYLNRLKELKVWNEQYDISLVNDEGNRNIPARYQDRYQNGTYEVVIFANPCTMQIIIKHWTDENIKSPAKKVNAPVIEKYTGVENYKGRAEQIKRVMECVTVENYADMCRRVSELDSDDSVGGSSNFGKFIKLFESDLGKWIEDINEELQNDENCLGD